MDTLEMTNPIELTDSLQPTDSREPREITAAAPVGGGDAGGSDGCVGDADGPDVSAGGGDALAALLAQAPPSAGALDTLARERLSAAGCVDAVVAWERLARHAHAGLLGALDDLTHAAGEEWLAEAEVCAALAWSPATAQNRLSEAHTLTTLFPATLHLLAEGRIGVEQARSLTQLTFGLDDQTAQAVEARILARMPGQSAPVTRQAIRRAVLRADPDAAAKRHRHERTRRRVELIPEDDGMPNFRL